ncbi:MAG: PRC-barrel domain-containing protein [Arachnia sp.]
MIEQEVPYLIGAAIAGEDGSCGRLESVVIDPIADVVTHVVVHSPHNHGAPRLVPVALLRPTEGSADGLHFHGTVADFFRLTIAEDSQFMPPPPGFTDYDQAMFWPYFAGESPPPTKAGVVTEEHLPAGEVDIRRGDPVHATDGEIGRVKGLVVTPTDRHLTHLLLQEGHLFGRKEVSIPLSAVTSMSNGVELSLTMQQVRDLPRWTISGSAYERVTQDPQRT